MTRTFMYLIYIVIVFGIAGYILYTALKFIEGV